ncbi:MAG TPA: acyltransferase family protein, partial [bacterium]|nr:acyltransferase family protein [bacterium]
GRLKGGVGFGLGVFLTMFSLLGLHFFQSLHMLTSAIFYSSFFIYGCVLAKYQEEVKAFLGKWTAWQKAALVLAALGLYNWEWEFSNVHYFGLDVKYNDLFTRTAPGLGSVLIISSALAFEKMQTILMNKKLLWVGKVSYSLYLIHMVVLQAAIYFFPGAIPLAGRVIFGGCLSFAVAGLSYQFLELPCINIGHALAKKLDGQRRLEPRQVSTVL